MKKLIIITLTIIVLVCAGGLVYLYNFTPEARAKHLASNYMSALLTNDTKKANGLYPVQPTSEEITQRNYRLVDISYTNNLYYILYNFTDNTKPTMIRIAADPGAIKEISVGSSLGAIPSEDKPEADDKAIQQSKCLEKSDLAYIDSTSIYARNIRGATMIFSPNSSNYITPNKGEQLLDRMANFYKRSHDKDFVFELKGYRQSDSLSDDKSEQLDDLFQKRAVTLQKELNGRGVPLDRVIINDKYNYYIPEQSTEVENDLYVDIDVVNRCIEM